MMQSIEHAAGSIKRVVAFRLKPGMDVLKGTMEELYRFVEKL